jgi:hypothetical protein
VIQTATIGLLTSEGDEAVRLKKTTQQRITKALNQMSVDLTKWLDGQGLSEDEAVNTLGNINSENGMMAGYVRTVTLDVLPIDSVANLSAEQVRQALVQLRSGELTTSLMGLPEPSPEELKRLLSTFKVALPKVRERFEGAARLGPPPRMGGNRHKILDPEERNKIRKIIESRKGPGVKMKDLDQSLADIYGVKPITIKRIRLEKPSDT